MVPAEESRPRRSRPSTSEPGADDVADEQEDGRLGAPGHAEVGLGERQGAHAAVDEDRIGARPQLLAQPYVAPPEQRMVQHRPGLGVDATAGGDARAEHPVRAAGEVGRAHRTARGPRPGSPSGWSAGG